jgi:tellurite resistance protein
VTGQTELDPRLQSCLDSFDKDSFEIGEAASVLQGESMAAKRKVLELIVAVHEADDSWDFSEDDYVRQVGAALGLAASDYADLVVGDMAIESGGFVVLPPPLPVDS